MKLYTYTLIAVSLLSVGCDSDGEPADLMVDARVIPRDAARMDMQPSAMDAEMHDGALAADMASVSDVGETMEDSVAPLADTSVLEDASASIDAASLRDAGAQRDAAPDVDAAPLVDASVIADADDIADAARMGDAGVDAEVAADAEVPDVGAAVMAICPSTAYPVGEFAEWCGKVNVHRPLDGDWAVDADCNSGCGQNPLNYCRELWPETNLAIEIGVSPEDKPFATAGCRVEHRRPGQTQYVCCAPNEEADP